MRSLLIAGVTTPCLAFSVSAALSQTGYKNFKLTEFMDTFGVNVHFNENGYKNVQAIADALNILGFSRVRTSCTNESDVKAWQDLASKTAVYFPQGLKADVLITGFMNALDCIFESQKRLIPQLGSVIETIEGPNEINNHYVGSGTHGPFDKVDMTDAWPATYAAWAKAVAAWKLATPTLAHVTLLAPCIASGDPADYARIPKVSEFVDAGNFHFYAGNGRQPSNFGGGNLAATFDWYRAAATPDQPVTITEWGQTTASRPSQAGCMFPYRCAESND